MLRAASVLKKFNHSQNFPHMPAINPNALGSFVDSSSKGLFISSIVIGYYSNLPYPLPHTPILGSSSSAANKDIMSKILTNGDTIF